MNAFSKKLVKNIQKKVEEMEKQIEHTISKQLIKKTKYFQDFADKSRKDTGVKDGGPLDETIAAII